MIGLVWVHETPCPACGEKLDYWRLSRQFGRWGRFYAYRWMGGFSCPHCRAGLHLDYTPFIIPVALNVLAGGVLIILVMAGLLPFQPSLAIYGLCMVLAFIGAGLLVRPRVNSPPSNR